MLSKIHLKSGPAFHYAKAYSVDNGKQSCFKWEQCNVNV
jgi:hypothetical protein